MKSGSPSACCKILRTVFTVLLMLFLLSSIFFAVDCHRVFERHLLPVVARPYTTADDGGSGVYRGIFYSLEVYGAFSGTGFVLSSANARILGFSVKSSTFIDDAKNLPPAIK